MNKGRTVEITSQRDLEKEFANISKLFIGKETEHNWDARDASIKRLRQFLKSELIEQCIDETLKGLHDHMSGIIKCVHSLRTSVAIEGLSLIEDIGCTLRDRIDIYTLETILSNLIKCSSNTKRMVAIKTEQVTIAFLTNTSFHTKILTMLCKTVSEKNVQLRQFSANYIKAMLSAHGSKESVRLAIENSELRQYIEQFLRKGLVDASPTIREACRAMYGAYSLHWPDQAERLSDSLDPAVQRQLGKPTNSNRLTSRPLIKRSNSASSVSSSLSNTTSATSLSSNSFRHPTLKRSTSLKINQSTIPATSAEVKRNLVAQRLSRLSHISNVSAPPTDISHKLNQVTASSQQQRRTQSEFHKQSVLASSSLLHMLKSSDTHMQCKGIRQLSQKLQNITYRPSSVSTTILPPGVPSRIDLVNVFTNMLSRNDFDLELYSTLMSWESLAGIFVYIMSLNYYGPTLIIANEECKRQHQTQKQMEINALYSKGLARIKMFLRRNDPHLPQQLLDLMVGLKTGDMELLDAHVKRDLMAYPNYMMSLQCGLLNWLDEVVCDYLGLLEDDDAEILMEGSKWLHLSTQQQAAGQWFDDNYNVRSLVRFILHGLTLQEQNGMYSILCRLIGHLKMANERVFEQEMNELDSKAQACVQKALYRQMQDDESMDDLLSIFDENQQDNTTMLNDFTVDSIPLQELYAEIVQEEVEKWSEVLDNHQVQEGYQNQSTGMTQEMSNINFGADTVPSEDKVIVDMPKKNQHALLKETGSIEVDFKEELAPPATSSIKVECSPIKENTNSAHDPHFQNKKKYARPAPEPSTSGIKNEKENENDLEPHKKRRQNEDILPDMTHGLSHCLAELSQRTATKTTFKRLQKLISNTSVTRDASNKAFWDQRRPNVSLFIVLLEALTSYINSQQHSSNRLQALDTVIKMAVDQHTLFKELEVLERNSTIYQLVRALIDNNSDTQSEIDMKAEKALAMLLSIHSPEFALRILWKLLGNYLSKENKIGSLFILISEIAPKASSASLEKSLRTGAAEILLWGYGHTNACVRKSSFLASAGIHQVLGDSYIGTYLPSLRPEQKTILIHYIETVKKKT